MPENEKTDRKSEQREICPNYKGLLLSSPTKSGERLLVRARCKQWSCPVCAKMNMRIWRAFLWDRITNKIGAYGWHFITLTAHENTQNHALERVRAVLSLANVREGIARLLKRLRRTFKDFAYVRIFEKHKSGAFHVHMIARWGKVSYVWRTKKRGKWSFSPDANKPVMGRYWSIKTYIKNTARECGLGFMCDVQTIGEATAGKVVSYVVKYMTKSALSDASFKGVRRIQTSRHFGTNDPLDGDLHWKPVNYIRSYELLISPIIDVNEKRPVTTDDFLIYETYPPILPDVMKTNTIS